MKKYSFAGLILVLIIVMFGVAMISCDSTESQLESEPEYVLERDDLIMVNLSTVKCSFGSTGTYIFFFEDYPTKLAYNVDVQIRFDPLVDKPIVRAKKLIKVVDLGPGLRMLDVEVVFRDREQMREYWIVEYPGVNN